jgi:hypothetical protein
VTRWTAGWNMPGYLPESEPVTFDTWREAHRYVVETVERFWDEDQDSANGVDADREWLPVHTTLHHVSEENGYSVVGERLTFWIEPTQDPDCADCAADPEGICPACDEAADRDNARVWAHAEEASR